MDDKVAFVKLPLNILSRKDLLPADKLVYAAIAGRIRDNSHAWPGYRKIAEDAGLTRLRAIQAVKRLVDLGILTVEKRGGDTNVYKLGGGMEIIPPTDEGVSKPYSGGMETILGGYENHTQNRRMNRSKNRSIPPISPKGGKERGLVEEIYQAYPRHIGHGAAVKAIQQSITRLPSEKPMTDPTWLLDRTKAFASSPAGKRGKFTPHPSTWFNQSRYLDDEAEWNPEKHEAMQRMESDFAELEAARERMGMKR